MEGDMSLTFTERECDLITTALCWYKKALEKEESDLDTTAGGLLRVQDVTIETDLPCNKCEFRRTKPDHVLAIDQIKFIKEQQRAEEFVKFLFNKTEVGVLDCQGLIEIEKLAEQILSFLLNRKSSEEK